MGKERFVKDLLNLINEEIEDVFLVKKIETKNSKDGAEYLEVSISDVTGEQTARIFDKLDDFKKVLKKGKVYKLRLSVYQFGSGQLGVKILEANESKDYKIEDFNPKSPRDRDEMWKELKDLINQVENPYLKELLKRIFLGDGEGDRDFRERFQIAPAAKEYHHDYVGGLLEHTLNVAKLALTVAKMYPKIDRDLLLTGALLHDIGKAYEYTYTPEIEYTTLGRLLGHIVIGFEIVQRKIYGMKFLNWFPEELEYKVLHMIISHHGERDYGSPIVPAFLEAQILHFLDDMDAKTDMFSRKAEELRSETDESWSEYLKSLKRYVYLGKPKEEENEGDLA